MDEIATDNTMDYSVAVILRNSQSFSLRFLVIVTLVTNITTPNILLNQASRKAAGGLVWKFGLGKHVFDNLVLGDLVVIPF